MSDHRTTIMENIFREMIDVIGYDKAVEILNSVPKKGDDKPKTEKKKKAEEKPKEEEKKKRIPRMSPTLATQLKTEMGKVGFKMNEDDKKEFDKIKKEFVTYIDDLTDDDFTAKGLADHMRDFANTKKPVEKAEDKPVEKAVEKAVEKPEKKKAEKKPKKVAEETTEQTPSSAATIVDVTLDELRAVKMLAVPGEDVQKGVYWDGAEGRWVRGPDADSDEDLVEKKFGGKSYMVGEVTGRVYEETDDRDVFHGFAGVGKFRDLKV